MNPRIILRLSHSPGRTKNLDTLVNIVQLGPGRQAQGAVRVVAAQRVPSTKATEHLAICEGLSVVEQRKWKTAGRGHHNGTSVHSSALRGHSKARHHYGTGVHISPVSRTVSQVFV